MDRRRALKLLGGSLALAAGVGVCSRTLLPPSPSASLASSDDLMRALLASFDAETRALAHVDSFHPVRQLHNRGLPAAGAWVMSLAREQRQLVVDLLHAGLSERGRARVPREYFSELPGVNAMKILIATRGDDVHQAVITGPHLNLRIGAPLEGVQVYGDQRGNEQPGIPGNLYADQLRMGQALYASLTESQRAAVVRKLPPQTQVVTLDEPRGVLVSSLGDASRAQARALVGAMMSNYRELDEPVDVDALHVSFAHDLHGDAVHFRFEGPNALLHFQGDPHVHAYVHVWDDEPLSLGDVVGEAPRAIEGADVARLFERAMKSATGADRALFVDDHVPGALRAGTVREGDVWALESFGNHVVVVEKPEGAVAMPAYAAEDLGLPVHDTGVMLRDATIAYARAHGFT